jgi:hypothetical protein
MNGKKVFDWLLDKYQIYISPKVRIECLSQIQKVEEDFEDPAYLKSELLKMVNNADFRECLDYLDLYCTKKKLLKFQKVHPGERHNFALAFHLSMRLRKPVILLTDDFDALKAYDELLGELKFGIAKSLPDFIINTYQTTEELEENITTGALQDYYNLMKRVDLRKKIYDDRMKWSCRMYWLDNCFAKCFC